MGKIMYMRKGNIHTAPGLPAEYTRISYIESNGKQYIDTGYKPNNRTTIEAIAQYADDSGTYPALFGARNGSNQQFWTAYSPAEGFFSRYNTVNIFVSAELTDLHAFTLSKNVFTIDESSISTAEATFQSNYNAYLFAVNAAGTASYLSSVKMYSCKIYEDDVLVRNYIPCVNSDNEPGLYDLVTKKFYSSQGNGSFFAPGEKPSGIPLSDIAVGTTIYLKEGGTPTEYIVVNQGIPSNSSLYDSGCNGTWLLRKDISGKSAWNNAKNGFTGSLLYSYLTNSSTSPIGRFGADVQNLIKSVKIPYYSDYYSVTYGPNSYFPMKVFPLSIYELGLSRGMADGAVLSYFNGSGNTNANRIAYYNGVATRYWTRTMDYYDTDAASDCAIQTDGTLSLTLRDTEQGVRFALILPSDTLVDANAKTLLVETDSSGTETYTVTVSQLGLYGSGSVSCSVTYDGTSYPEGSVITVPSGSSVLCHTNTVVSLSGGTFDYSIYLNGTKITTGHDYTHTVTKNCSISISASGRITITEE